MQSTTARMRRGNDRLATPGLRGTTRRRFAGVTMLMAIGVLPVGCSQDSLVGVVVTRGNTTPDSNTGGAAGRSNSTGSEGSGRGWNTAFDDASLGAEATASSGTAEAGTNAGGSTSLPGSNGVGGTRAGEPDAAGTASTWEGGTAGVPKDAGGARGTGGSMSVGPTDSGGEQEESCTGCKATEACWHDSSGSRCVSNSVPLPVSFAIDATEVTREQYAAWLATNPDTQGQSPACDWNTSFAPDSTCMANPSVCQGPACGAHPQACVDMCDASAYCRAIGRRLCTEAQWMTVCTSNGVYPVSYGSTMKSGVCNDYLLGNTTTVPVASKTGCHAPADSGFAGVFDMIGNIAEWVDNCDSAGGASDSCRPRGLSFGNGSAAPTCSEFAYAERDTVGDTVGFRCCAP